VKVRFIGCGDAFGSGGRFNTCFHVFGESVNFLIDCGASSLIGLKSQGVPLNKIQAIFVTHYHADHFGGIPFFMLDAQFFAKRREPLVIVGPRGLQRWYERSMETAFFGSSTNRPKFALSLIELAPGQVSTVCGVVVTPFQAIHGSLGGPFLSYRLEAEGKSIAYTGDTEWSDTLIAAGRDVDLFISEAYFRNRKVKFHLDLASLEAHLAEVQPKRLVLTHMSDDMLEQLGELRYETAHDGMVVNV
jgi:ribonuclease BN (tRNA processing enzyme)